MNYIRPAELRTGDFLVVDVRTADAYEAGHIPGARNVPFDALVGRVDELPSGRSIVLVCGGGPLSERAHRHLAELGVAGSRYLLGGTRGWAAEGHPVSTGSRPAPPAAPSECRTVPCRLR